jgi:hypothetical protein
MDTFFIPSAETVAFHSEFTKDFVHLPGHRNVVANALSRPSSPSPTSNSSSTPTAVAFAVSASLLPLPLSYLDLAKKQ